MPSVAESWCAVALSAILTTLVIPSGLVVLWLEPIKPVSAVNVPAVNEAPPSVVYVRVL